MYFDTAIGGRFPGKGKSARDLESDGKVRAISHAAARYIERGQFHIPFPPPPPPSPVTETLKTAGPVETMSTR